jgi:ribose/xylose/arabinose/galactoside ABC-type transport system permease subunit
MIRWLTSILTVLGPLVALIGVIAFFALVDLTLHGDDATFWSRQNLQSISVQNAFVAICALGMLLVIISGGIDLSAGAALALCATIFAWGLREDAGFLLSHGENVAGAVVRLRSAEAGRRDAVDANDANQIARTTSEVQRRRDRLIELLQMKRARLELGRADGVDPDGMELERKIADIDEAIIEVRNPDRPVAANPAWLRSVPNAASTAALAVAMCMATGMLCGLINGMLIVVLRVVPFIATLGTMTIFLGLALIVADETSVRPSVVQTPTWLGELSAVRPDPAWLLVSKGVWLALLLAAVLAIVLKYSVFGRHVFAIGSNEATARLCGINVSLVKICVYTMAGLFVGIAAVCFFARLNSGNPTSGTGLELKFIAAVVIGGASLSGGRGTVLGTLAGTAIMGVIASGGTLLGLSNPTQYIALGMIVIVAVAIDQLRKSRTI